MRILVIDDVDKSSNWLSQELGKHGYKVDIAENMKDGEYLIGVRSYDIILSGWNLKEGNGEEVILNIKSNVKKNKNKKSPIIIISNTFEHEIQAFKHGADDYINRPFKIEILIARIEARLKLISSNLIKLGDLCIVPEEEKIFYKDIEIEVKGKSFEVLTHLARLKGQIVSKEQLLNAIWDEPELVTPNVIEVAINQIRQKMDNVLNSPTIETVRRRGYRFCYPKK